MDQDLEISRFSILFGEEPDPENCSKINLSVDFSQKLTKNSIDTLKTSSKGEIAIDKALVIEIMTASQEKSQELLSFIEELNSGEIETIKQKYGDIGGMTWTCIHSTDQRRIMLSIQGSEKVMGFILDPIQTLLDSGLSKVSDNKGNSIEFNLHFSQFEPLVDKFLDSQNITAAFLNKFKIEGKIYLCKDLSEMLSQVFEKIDPDFNQSPPMMFTKYFKMVDIDLRFNSIEELPKAIKSKIFNPFLNVFTFSAEQKVNWDNNKFLAKFKELINGQIIMHANLNNFVTLKLDINLPGLSKLIDVLFAGFKERPFTKFGLAKSKYDDE